MGQSVICSCGQRNNLDSYRYGEPRLCVACGQPLSPPPVTLPEEPAGALESDQFKAEAFDLDATDFEAASGDGGEPILTGFETPGAEEVHIEPAPAPRPWQDGVREAAAAVQEDLRCAHCKRPFRGDWDKNDRNGQLLCHICAVQADPAYKAPDVETKRALFRPEPPKKIAPKNPRDDSEERERRQKKAREMILLATSAVVVLVVVNVFPVEVWVAMFFAADLTQAEELSAAWHWLLYAANFTVGAAGHMAALYVALSLSNLLYPGGIRQNIGPILYLGIAFEILNTLLALAAKFFPFFGPLGMGLIGMAFVIMLVIKYLMVSERFHVGFEGFVGLILAWVMASLLVKPGVFALLQLIQGIVAAIAL